VLCVDNYFTGAVPYCGISSAIRCFEALRHDVTLPLFVGSRRDLQFACPASPIHYQFDPVATTKVSVHGAINMLGLASG